MKWRNITSKDLRKVVNKLSLAEQGKRRAKHPVYWYLLDDRKQFKVTLPNIHGGSGSISTGFLKKIQKQLRLETQQFEDLVECPLTDEDYEAIIRTQLDI